MVLMQCRVCNLYSINKMRQIALEYAKECDIFNPSKCQFIIYGVNNNNDNNNNNVSNFNGLEIKSDNKAIHLRHLIEPNLKGDMIAAPYS